MPGVNRYHLHGRFLGFVAKKSSELVKRPAMQAALPFAFSHSGAVPNLSQIFNHNRCANGGTLDNPFREEVVTVPVESQLSTRQLSKVALGTLCSFGLQSPFDTKITAIYFLPVFISKKFTLASNRWVVKTKVYPDSLTAIRKDGFGNTNHLCWLLNRFECGSVK